MSIKKTVSYFSTLLVLMLLYFSVSAQTEKIRFKEYTIDHGLSQNTVFCLLQDKDGIIWVGTEDGLNKFDGYTFTAFKHRNQDSKSISNNQINALFEDKEGKIWVGTSAGINLYDKKTESFE